MNNIKLHGAHGRPTTVKARGFSLVEVSLALLVVSVGILGAFAMIPAGLRTNKAGIDDTKSAMLAESIFETLRAQAWVSTNFYDVGKPGPCPFGPTGMIGARPFWGTTSTPSIVIADSATPPDTLYVKPLAQAATDINIADLYVNYRLHRLSSSDRKATFCLEVFPDVFYNVNTPPLVFYTEILNPR